MKSDDAHKKINFGQARKELGIAYYTLEKYIGIAGIEPKRVGVSKEITYDDLEKLRKVIEAQQSGIDPSGKTIRNGRAIKEAGLSPTVFYYRMRKLHIKPDNHRITTEELQDIKNFRSKKKTDYDRGSKMKELGDYLLETLNTKLLPEIKKSIESSKDEKGINADDLVSQLSDRIIKGLSGNRTTEHEGKLESDATLSKLTEIAETLKKLEPSLYRLAESIKKQGVVKKGTILRRIGGGVEIKAGSDIIEKDGTYESLIGMLREKAGDHLNIFLNAYEEKPSTDAEETLTKIYDVIPKIGTGSYGALELYKALYATPPQNEYSDEVNLALMRKVSRLLEASGTGQLQKFLSAYNKLCGEIKSGEIRMSYRDALKNAGKPPKIKK